MFSEMMEGIKEESVGSLFNLQVQAQEAPIVEEADPGAGPQAVAPRTAPAGTAANGGRPGRPRPSAFPRAAAQGAPDGPVIPAGLAPRGPAAPQRPSRLQYSAPSEDGTGKAEQRTESAGSAAGGRVGRNDLCPCGSGRKYKRCHGDPRTRQGA